jgi:hypothetical protein
MVVKKRVNNQDRVHLKDGLYLTNAPIPLQKIIFLPFVLLRALYGKTFSSPEKDCFVSKKQKLAMTTVFYFSLFFINQFVNYVLV